MGGKQNTRKPEDTVFIIEDDRAIRKLLKNTFVKNRYKVLAADTGREAMGLIQKHSDEISVIIMDLNLSDINGIEIIEKMKPLIADKRLVITTGLSVNRAKETFPDMKITYLDKPYNIEDLVDFVTEKAAL